MSPDPVPLLNPDFDDRPNRPGAPKRTTGSVPSITPTGSPAIRSELAEIGAVLDLPTRVPTNARSSAAIEESAPKMAAPLWRQHAAVAVIALGALGLLLSRMPETSPPLPEDLLGEWATTFTDYEEHRLGFTEDEVMLGMSADGPLSRHRISAVSLSGPRDSASISLTYTDDEGDVEMNATLLLRGQPRLVFSRPAGLVWERKVSTAAR